jgi:hypothetical protein
MAKMAKRDPYREDVTVKAAIDAARHQVLSGARKPWWPQVMRATEYALDYYGAPTLSNGRPNPHYDPIAAGQLRDGMRLLNHAIESYARCARREVIGDENECYGLVNIYTRAQNDITCCLVMLRSLVPTGKHDRPFPDVQKVSDALGVLYHAMRDAIGESRDRHAQLGARMRYAAERDGAVSFTEILNDPSRRWGERER